jgi:hypothetical protein
VGERLAAGSITQDVDDAQQYGRSRPVTERSAGLREQASCPEQSPAFWESLKEGKGLTQDFDGFGGIPFPRQAVGKHYLAIAAESAVSRPGENANARDGQELGTGNVARQGLRDPEPEQGTSLDPGVTGLTGQRERALAAFGRPLSIPG